MPYINKNIIYVVIKALQIHLLLLLLYLINLLIVAALVESTVYFSNCYLLNF